MKLIKTERGFLVLEHPAYLPRESEHKRLVGESSAIGDYEDSFERPGSSYLWIGDHHHLNREEVEELVLRLQYWLEHKRLGKAGA